MATATAFGSITIIDVTDIGEFSVYPMSNMPLTVVYDPDEGSYTPTWSNTTPLTLKPVVYYAGKALSGTSTGLSITWTKMTGITESPLTSNELKGADGVLSVTNNQFNDSVNMVTYIVTANYTEPTSGASLTATGQITFSLVKNSSAVRSVVLSGDNVFKYDTNSNVDKNSITLTATCTNTSVESWQYKHPGDTTWHVFSNQTAATLNIPASSTCFSHNGTAYDNITVQVTAHDNKDTSKKYYDTIAIIKLRDGAAGTSAVSMVLSNESQMVPCDNENNPTSNGNLGSTTVQIYVGGKEDLSYNSLIEVIPNGVTGVWDSATATYTVTGWNSSNTSDIASVNFKVIVNNSAVQKSMTLTKIKTGADGKSPAFYALESTSLVSNLTKSGSYSPSSLIITATKTEGSDVTAYAGYLTIQVDDHAGNVVAQTMSNGTYTINSLSGLTYTSDGKTYGPQKYITCKLYTGADGTLLDTQTIVITNDGVDGEKGDQGENGIPALNIVLGNYADTIAVTSKGLAAQAIDITIPFTAYCGTKKIQCNVSAPPRICNNTVAYNTASSILTSTSTTDGRIVYKIASGTNLGSTAMSGSVTYTFTIPAQNVTIGSNTYTITSNNITCNYTWTLSKASAETVVFQLLTPDGYAFENGEGTLRIQPYMLSGSTDVTSSATYKWYKGPSYTNQLSDTAGENTISGNVLTVYGTSVDGYASYKCEANYDNNTYVQYVSLIDKTDPVQAFVYSTLGTQITNGNGVGALYCIVTRNGEEVDPIATRNFTATAPVSSYITDDNKCYYVNSTDKSVYLYTYNTSTKTWAKSGNQPTYTGNYTWTFRGADNEEYSHTNLKTNNKIIYIDAAIINKKISAEVEIQI